MAEIAQRHANRLESIKENIKVAHDYFHDNYQRFSEFRKFVFDTTMTPDDIAVLKETGKPQLEFNILEAYVSRLRGEFSKQVPSIEVTASDGYPADPTTIEIVDMHMRSLLDEARNDGLEYDVYTDLLTGGFSAIEVYTEYANERSFNQNICLRRVFDPTLTGFDPMSRTSHKGDGNYCFELYPVTREEFEDEYGKDSTKGIKFTKQLGDFSWSFQGADQVEILMRGRYFEKKKKKGRIVQLTTGDVMTVDEYEKFLEEWDLSGKIMQPPGVIGKPRTTEFDTIVQYKLIENKILERVETDYRYFPLIFVDGNSIFIKSMVGGNNVQKTRPYIYNAKGVQKLKNFAGQTLANALENLVQHKFIVAKEAIPEDYVEAYENVQKANTLVYNAFKSNDPTVPLPPPREIQMVGLPPEVTGAFGMSDEVTQSILGSYDASLGINKNQLSGVAIVEGATQSNSAAMPYVVGFMKGLNRAAEVILDLIPKYYTTPRTIPLKRGDGKHAYIPINQPPNKEGFKIDYKENSLHVKVKAGVNFEIQKARALDTMVSMMQASPTFAEFMNRKGLPLLLDNLDIRGIDQLKVEADQFMKEIEEQAEAMRKQQAEAGQMNPIVIEAKLADKQLNIQKEKNDSDSMLKASSIAVDKQKADTERLEALARIGESRDKMIIERDKMQAEETREAVGLAIKHSEQLFKHNQSKEPQGVQNG